MALTLAPGPLSARPGTLNYTVDGPKHRILLAPSQKRVRVVVMTDDGPVTVVDSTDAVQLHETGLLPRYYVPEADLAAEALARSSTTSHCPFKGDATYRSVESGGRKVADLFFSYPDPDGPIPALAGLVGLYLEKLDVDGGDAVFEEEQQVIGHPRDPFHRVDALRSSRHVRVLWRKDPDDEPIVLADTITPVGVFETGLPVRWYVPVADVRTQLLTDSTTTTVCPYKGRSHYLSLVEGPVDVAWGYEDPLPEALPLPGHLSFDGEGISIEVAPTV